MHDNKVATCSCTLKFCGHDNELMCGKPLSEQATSELQFEKEKFVNYGLGLCAECFARHRAIALGLMRPA